jgi:uncharacterized membrane protein YdbT with pleckstrin-like domain
VSYVDRILQPGETVIHTGRMHWIIYVRGLFFAVLGGVIMPTPFALASTIVGGILLLFGVYMLIASWIEQITTEVAVTNKRVIQKRGLIRRLTGEMNMDKVESVIVDQSLLGRVLNYGSIVVRGTGSGIEGLDHIADPLSLRSSIVVR